MIERNITLGDTLEISGNDAHHIFDVLRLRSGDWIVLSDGRGGSFRCEIRAASKKTVSVLVVEKSASGIDTSLTLAQALTKHDKFEFIIQKAVELGVTNIIPFVSERTVPTFSGDRATKKIGRWNRIAVEASKQCGLGTKPEVKKISGFEELVVQAAPFKQKMMFYEGEKERLAGKYFEEKIAKMQKKPETIIIIGPEGGFSKAEVGLAIKSGFTTLGLGPLILRTETAAIVAVTLTQFYLGHFAYSNVNASE